MNYFQYFLAIFCFVEAGVPVLHGVTQPDSCNLDTPMNNFEAFIRQGEFLQNETFTFTAEQLVEIARILKVATTIDPKELRPSFYLFNSYCMDHLIEMRKHFTASLVGFLTEDYERADMEMDRARQAGACFKQSLTHYYEPQQQNETGSARRHAYGWSSSLALIIMISMTQILMTF